MSLSRPRRTTDLDGEQEPKEYIRFDRGKWSRGIEDTAEWELSGPNVNGLPVGGPGYVSVTFCGEDGKAEGQQSKVTHGVLVRRQ